MKMKVMEEEGVIVQGYEEEMSKKLPVFYNPLMKVNRDMSILVIEAENLEKIKYCDPLCASGIREMRFLKSIPERFEKIICGDISENAVNTFKNYLKVNKLDNEKVQIICSNANETLSSGYFNMIEIDPFGSPVPFLDMAMQRIKDGGILSVTATDTAALCGTYPKTALRKYGIRMKKTLWFEELGLRNLIGYCIREGGKYEKELKPILSYTHRHYYRVFFKVRKNRTLAYENILNNIGYVSQDKISQEIQISKFSGEEFIGPTFIGDINDKKVVARMLEIAPRFIQKADEVKKLLLKLLEEENIIGYYNLHKLEKAYNFSSGRKYEEIIEELRSAKYLASKTHNSKYGIKTNAKIEVILEIMKRKK